MTVVNGKLITTASVVMSGWQVRGVLFAASPVSTTGELVDEAVTTSAADGTWSLALVSNTLLVQPAGSYYSIEVREPPSGEWIRIATCSVPATGPVNLRDILVVPSGIGSLAVLHSLAVAKGDILAATGPGAFVRIPKSGVDGRVLTEDSLQVAGVKWAAGGGGTGGAVNSVFGRIGDVVAQVADYTAFYQPLDSDLTAIASLVPLNDDVIQRKAGAWVNRAMAQLAVDLNPVVQLPSTAKVTGLDAALTAKADLVAGVVPSAQIPAIAISEYLGSVPSQAAMLALVGQKGDWCIRTDVGAPSTWIISGVDATLIGNWTQISTPTDLVLSVNGQTGAVTLSAANVGAQPADADLTTIAGLVATTDNVIQSVAGAWASRTPAQVKTTLALVKGDVGLVNVDNTSDAAKPVSTAQQAALDLKAPLASPTFTGTVTEPNVTRTGRTLRTTTTLVDGVTIPVDASLNDHFTVTLGGNRTLANPTNPPAAGQTQLIMFAIRQDAVGSRTLTLDTAYRFGTDITSITLSTAINKTDYLGVRYNATDAKWDVILFLKGF